MAKTNKTTATKGKAKVAPKTTTTVETELTDKQKATLEANKEFAETVSNEELDAIIDEVNGVETPKEVEEEKQPVASGSASLVDFAQVANPTDAELTSLEELKTELIGEIGSEARDNYEKDLQIEIETEKANTKYVAEGDFVEISKKGIKVIQEQVEGNFLIIMFRVENTLQFQLMDKEFSERGFGFTLGNEAIDFFSNKNFYLYDGENVSKVDDLDFDAIPTITQEEFEKYNRDLVIRLRTQQ